MCAKGRLGGEFSQMTPESQPRRNRLILVVGSVVVVAALLYMARGALFPFIVAGVLGYALAPVVKGLERLMPWRERWPSASRVAAVLLIYLLAIAVIVGALALIIPPAFGEARDFVDEVPKLYTQARTTIEGWNEEYTERVPEDLRAEIEERVGNVGSVLISAARTVLARTVSGVSNTLTLVISLAIVPIFLFYVLKDQEVALRTFYSMLPEPARGHARNVLGIVNQTLGAYIRGQLILSVAVGVLVFAGLTVLGIRFAVLLALVAGATELIPVIGPILGAVPGVLVALATSPGDLLWVLLLYLLVQQIENVFLVPRVQGKAVNIHPAFILVVLVVGSETGGLWGMVVAVPLAGVAKDVFRYFYNEWSEPVLVAKAEGGAIEETGETEEIEASPEAGAAPAPAGESD